MCCPRVRCGGEALQLCCLSIIHLPWLLNAICVAINLGTIFGTQHLESLLHTDSIARNPCTIIFKHPANQFLYSIEGFVSIASWRAVSLRRVRYWWVGWTVARGSGTDGSDVGPPERAASITRKSKFRSYMIEFRT